MTPRRAVLAAVAAPVVAMMLAAGCGTTDRSFGIEESTVPLFDDEGPDQTDLPTSTPSSAGVHEAPALRVEDLPAPRTGVSGVVVVDDVLLPVEVSDEGLVAVGPCGQSVVVEQQPQRDLLVILDPVGETEAFALVEPIMALAAERLNAAQIRATVTRSDSTVVAAPTRAAAAVASGARLLVSMGLQEVADETAAGQHLAIDVFHQIDSSQSRRFGGLLHENIQSVLETYDVSWLAASGSGVRPLLNQRGTDFYTMLRDTEEIDSVVVLLGGRAADTETLLGSASGRSELADALVDAIVRQFMTNDVGGGYIQPSETVRNAPTADGAPECGS